MAGAISIGQKVSNPSVYSVDIYCRLCPPVINHRRFQTSAGDAVLEITSQLSTYLIKIVGMHIPGYLVIFLYVDGRFIKCDG
jgi:hypothetical protein